MELRPITNRDFKLPDDGWIQVAPLGEHPHPSGIIQVLDKEACEAMVNRFNEEAKSENFPGLLLDFDHFSSDTKAPSTAAGWIEKLENRADGLWAQVRWSTDGEAAIKGGNYRLVSPVWNRSQCEVVGNPDDKKFRPQRLDRAALTNDPVLKGMCPVSNRSGSGDDADTVTRSEMAQAIADAVKEAVENRGNSAGAHKGWETRRGALAAYHSNQAAHHLVLAGHARENAALSDKSPPGKGYEPWFQKAYSQKSPDEKKAFKAEHEAKAEFHEKQAAKHSAIAKTHSDKAKTSGTSAKGAKLLQDHLAKLKGEKKATPPPLPTK